MTRLRLVALAALAVLAGCGSGDPGAAPPAPSRTAPASPSVTAPDSASASASPAMAIEFTVDGAGPYQLGATLDQLRSTVDEVSAGNAPCAQNTTARGTGTWHDIQLSFRPDGVMYLAVNRSPSIPTPSGAWLGTPLAQLKKIYAGITGQDLAKGSHRAYLVTTISGRGILFDLDAKTTVIAMYAADAGYLKNAFAAGAFC